MALIDNNLMFSDGQAVTVNADSTNYIDLGAALDLGAGERMYLFLVFGAVTSNATLVTTMSGDDDAGGTNSVDILVTPAITPVANSFKAWPIPPHTRKRYVKLAYTIAGGVGPSIAVTATIEKDVEQHLLLSL